MQADCQKLFIDNKANLSIRKERLKDFLWVCEEYFVTNFGSTLLLIGWVHVQYSIHLINVKVGPVCVVGKKCTGKTQLLEAIGCLLPLLKNLMGQYNINKLNTVTKSVLTDFMCEDNPPLLFDTPNLKDHQSIIDKAKRILTWTLQKSGRNYWRNLRA